MGVQEMDKREEYLQRFAGLVWQHATSGTFGKRFEVQVRGVVGPRAGALNVWAGVHTGAMLRALTRDDAALLRQLIPWDFGANRPNAFMSGRYLRLDAAWPDGLAEKDIPLRSLGQHPDGDGRWIAGKNESGDTITLGFNLDRTPHWLFSGTTGSGKTVAVHCALTQLAHDPQNAFVLVDGKRGRSLKPVERLRGRIGPMAQEPEQWRMAMLYANDLLNKRLEQDSYDGRVIVVVEEVQEVTQDPTCAKALSRLVTLGREVEMHCLVTTQHPTVKALGGPKVTRNLAGRLALKVTDDVASRVAIGQSSPRADFLLGRGDEYAVSVDAIHRAQGAYPQAQDFARVCWGDAQHAEWPIGDGDLGQDVEIGHRGEDPLTADEVGASIVAAALGYGRRRFKGLMRAISGGDAPGSPKAKRLMDLGEDVLAWFDEHDVFLDATTFSEVQEDAFDVTERV